MKKSPNSLPPFLFFLLVVAIGDYIDEEEDSKFRAIDNVSFDVEAGQFITILGHNGSGKSSLAKHINALLMPTEGSVWIDGIETTNEERVLDIRQTAGMVFQNPDNQIVATVVEEDVAFGPENLGIEPNEIRKRVEESLKSVGMYELRDRQPHLLSGGQKQRVAIVRALIMHPEIILFDEVTAALDPEMVREVLDVMLELAKQGSTMLIVTHEMEFAKAVADKIVFLDGGNIVETGEPKEFFSNPKTERAGKFLNTFVF